MNIKEYLEENPKTGRRKLAKLFNISESKARKIVKEFKENQLKDNSYDDLLKHTVDLELNKQRLLDERRVERKIREEYRTTSHLKQLTDELINCFNDYKTPEIKQHRIDNKSSIGIFQFSDAHFNEIIDTPSNKYDFEIASKRAKKFVHESILYFQLNKVDTVIFAMTGDMINSDRRPDEKILMATSRAKAVYIATTIIEQMIIELNQYFNIKVAFVVGNESRSYEIGTSDIIMSDNYDLTIISMLKLMFRDTKIEFLKSNLVECILNIKNKNILIVHGDKLSGKNMQKSIQELKGKYTQHGIIIDYIIMGHIHEAYISDQFARSSSLSGGNGYSEFDLGFSSRASQNIHIINDEWINSIKIDLQQTDYIEGYYIDQTTIKEINKCKDISKFTVIKI